MTDFDVGFGKKLVEHQRAGGNIDQLQFVAGKRADGDER